MNWDMLEGNWSEFKGLLRQQWGELTDDELESMKGQREALIGRIQQKYGTGKEEVQRQLETMVESVRRKLS